MDEFYETEVARGLWLYDNVLRKGVVIKVINYDYWYELEKSDGFDMADETPHLNENGEMYIIYWTNNNFKKIESYTVGTLDLDSTIIHAESVVQQEIEWI